eukprot:gene28843-32032_t
MIRVAPISLHVPVTLSNLLLGVYSRITLKPLCEVIPITGGLNVALMTFPILDFSLELFRGIDLMALPIVKDLVRSSLKLFTGIDLMALPIVKDLVRSSLKGVLNGMLVYPNSITVPIMENFGIMPPAKGAMSIKLLKVEGLSKGYMHCDMMVDSFENQVFKLAVWAVDKVGNTQLNKLAVTHLPFGQKITTTSVGQDGKPTTKADFELEDFILNPNQEREITLPLCFPKKVKSMISAVAAKASMGIDVLKAAQSTRLDSVGARTTSTSLQRSDISELGGDKDRQITSVFVKVTWNPFLRSTAIMDEEISPTEALSCAADAY